MIVPGSLPLPGIRVFAFVLLFLCSPLVKSQDDIHIDKIEGGDWLRFYLDQTSIKRGFVNGREYYDYYFRSMHSPILRDDEPRTAILTFRGRTYNNLDLQYDTYTDEVVYAYDSLILGDKFRKVSLNKYDVDRFDLCFRKDTMHFMYLSTEIDSSFSLNDGFYEIAHDSKTKFIIRHVSVKYTILDSPGTYAIDDYQYKPVNYINTGDGYKKITSRKQFVRLFNSSSSQISRFLRTNRINIRKADKRQISVVLNYYEQLN